MKAVLRQSACRNFNIRPLAAIALVAFLLISFHYASTSSLRVVVEHESRSDAPNGSSAAPPPPVENDAPESPVQPAPYTPAPPVIEKPAAKCLPHVIYDKPVKTASTAVAYAIRDYLNSRGERDKRSNTSYCPSLAEQLCNGTFPESEMFSLVCHQKYVDGVATHCLRNKGYYSVTSVRDPLERRTSAFLFNRHTKDNHYGIPWDIGFADFMARFPKCILFHYYDGLGSNCATASMSVEDRVAAIAARQDEVIDIYDEPVGPLHKKIAKYLENENVSDKPQGDFLEDFDHSVMDEEYMLYNKLREIRLRKPDPNRLPC